MFNFFIFSDVTPIAAVYNGIILIDTHKAGATAQRAKSRLRAKLAKQGKPFANVPDITPATTDRSAANRVYLILKGKQTELINYKKHENIIL